MTFLKNIPLSFLAIALVACASQSTPAVTGLEPEPVPTTAVGITLVLGDISDDPAEVIEGSQPLANYLTEKLKPYGVTKVEVRIAASTDEMVTLLKNGEVDLYADSVYPATLISDAAGAQIILRRWRFGVETYQSVIFTTKDSGIVSLDDLRGKMVAMDAPYSTSGFMLPAVHLTDFGLKLTGKPNYDAEVASDEVGFVFSYDDENTLQWILSDLVQAGVTDDYNFDTAFPRDVAANLVELGRTEFAPRQVMVARAGINSQVLAAIKEVLINMHNDPLAENALKSYQTTRFDEFPEGIDAATARMREMMQIVKGIALP